MKVEEMKSMIEEQAAMIVTLAARIEALEGKVNTVKAEVKEMTDADAESILVGEFRDLKHKEAAEKLGLTYGQIYSARLGYTFKHVVKRLKDSGQLSQWVK
jgi:DNA-directed RNA polymerase specialized sigma24 family protein